MGDVWVSSEGWGGGKCPAPGQPPWTALTSPTCALSKYRRIITGTILLSTFTCFYRYYYYHSVTLTFDLWPWIFAMRQLRWAKQVYLLSVCLCLWSLTSKSQWPPQKLGEKNIPAPYSPAVDEFASSRLAPPFAIIFLVSLKNAVREDFRCHSWDLHLTDEKNGQHRGWKIAKLQQLYIHDVHTNNEKVHRFRRQILFLEISSYFQWSGAMHPFPTRPNSKPLFWLPWLCTLPVAQSEPKTDRV